MVEAVEERVLLTSFLVTKTLDDGSSGTLRWAIQQANVAGGEIDFNIFGSGVHTISVTSPLPALTASGAIIDGTTQPGYAAAGHPLITIDGTGAGTAVNGLRLASTGQTVKGLAIDHFNGSGVYVGGGGGAATITADYIGIDATGTTAAGNLDGVELDSLANNCQILNNVISGSAGYSIFVATLGHGIYIHGADPNTNTITGTVIQGNLIGTNATGTAAVGNTGDGIYDLNSVNTHIGGTTPAQRNIVSGNQLGMELFYSVGIVVEGNYIGPDVSGTTAIGNNSDNGAMNSGNGIFIGGASGPQIGGTAPGAGNVISGNRESGVLSSGAGYSPLIFQDNYVGVDATGTAAMGNGSFGAYVAARTSLLVTGNVVANNGSDGLIVDGGSTADEVVHGNLVGTDATGTKAMGNSGRGILVDGLASAHVTGNVVANNGSVGIHADGQSGSLVIQGNLIGTDATGTKAMGNNAQGLLVTTTGSALIGGTTPGTANVIVNNKTIGIEVDSNSGGSCLVEGNLIGTDATGTLVMGNGAYGVYINGSGNTVGGMAFGDANTIVSNGYVDAFANAGVGVNGNNNAILSNAIYHNKQLGISLNGVMLKGNNNQAAPVLSSAYTTGSTTTVTGTLTAAASTAYTVQFFANDAADPSGAYEGQVYLGSTVVTTLANGTASFTATLPVAVTVGQHVTATATDPSGNTSQFSTSAPVVTGIADMAVGISASAGTVQANQNITYTLTVTNNGPTLSRGVVLNDTLPTGLTFVSATSTQGSTPTDAGGVVSATIGDMAAGTTATVTITVTATAAAAPSVTNTGVLSLTDADPNLSNNTASITTNVTPVIDLALSGSGSPSPVGAGQNLTYTLTVTNNGPSPATGVTLTDALPAAVTFVSATPSSGTANYASGIVTANLGSVASGSSATLTIVVTVGAGGVPTIVNGASVTANETDSNLTNNSLSISTTVTPVVDLAVSISPSPSSVLVGQNLTYTVSVTNNGPSTATGVTFNDTLSAAATFVSAISDVGTTPVKTGNTLSSVIGTLAKGASAHITIVITPTATAPPSVADTASALAIETDSNSANNTASVSTTVTPAADTAISSMTVTPGPVGVGQSITYTIGIVNNGPSPATGVVLTQNLPAGVTYVSASSTVGTASQSSGVVTANIGTLANGATATITVVVTATAGAVGSPSSTATLKANELDTSAANNTRTATTQVVPAADLAVTITPSPDPALATMNLTYTIVVTNNGPSPATGVTLTDTLPPGAAYVSATSDTGATPTQTGGTVTAAIGTLASGASARLTIVVTPDNATGSVSDTVSVLGNEFDTNMANNTATTSSTVNPASDLAVALAPLSGQAVTGSPFAYIVSAINAGPSDAKNVTLVLSLPSSMSFTSGDPTLTSIAVSGGVVTMGAGTIPVGTSHTYVITVTPLTPGDATVTLAGSSDATDPVTSNNTATSTTTVVTPPGTFVFDKANFITTETAGTATITIDRTDGYQGAVTVHFSTGTGGVAKPGVDYTPTSQTVTFGQGETSKTVTVPVLANPHDNHDETVALVLDTPTGGAKLGVQSTAVLTITDTDPDKIGPTITDVHLTGTATAISRIDVLVSEVLNPSTVTAANFEVTDVGTFGVVGPGNNRAIPLATVSYNAALGLVSLTPMVPLKAGHFYQVRVVGSGNGPMTDLTGNPLNSILGVTPGYDYVSSFARGTTLNYADEYNTPVTVRISGGGLIDLDRAWNGHVTRLQVLGAVPGRTTLTGAVKSRGAMTTIDSFLGLGKFGSIRGGLLISPFKVTTMPFTGATLFNPPAVDTVVKTPVVKPRAVVAVPRGPLVRAARVKVR